jgi:hypothetical protein
LSKLLVQFGEEPAPRAVLRREFTDAGGGAQYAAAIEEIDRTEAQREEFPVVPRIDMLSDRGVPLRIARRVRFIRKSGSQSAAVDAVDAREQAVPAIGSTRLRIVTR